MIPLSRLEEQELDDTLILISPTMKLSQQDDISPLPMFTGVHKR